MFYCATQKHYLHCFVWLKSDIFYLADYTCFGFQTLINIWLNIKQMETRNGWSMIWVLNPDLLAPDFAFIKPSDLPVHKKHQNTFEEFLETNPLMKESRTGPGWYLYVSMHQCRGRPCLVFHLGLISKGFHIKIHIFWGQVINQPSSNHILFKW